MMRDQETISDLISPPPPSVGPQGDVLKARWVRLAGDFDQLAVLDPQSSRALVHAKGNAENAEDAEKRGVRDVGQLLLLGHEQALADAEAYISEGHTIRTGHVVEFDDIDDEAALRRWTAELDRASARGWAPPAPNGFWASFLHWRTPLGMARLTERRIPARRRVD